MATNENLLPNDGMLNFDDAPDKPNSPEEKRARLSLLAMRYALESDDYMALPLVRHEASFDMSEPEAAAHFALSIDKYIEFKLCRLPQDDDDVKQIAKHIGVPHMLVVCVLGYLK